MELYIVFFFCLFVGAAIKGRAGVAGVLFCAVAVVVMAHLGGISLSTLLGIIRGAVESLLALLMSLG